MTKKQIQNLYLLIDSMIEASKANDMDHRKIFRDQANNLLEKLINSAED